MLRKVSRAHPTADTLVVERSAFVIRKRERGPAVDGTGGGGGGGGGTLRAPAGQEAHAWELVQVDVNVLREQSTREQRVQVRLDVNGAALCLRWGARVWIARAALRC